MTEGRLVRLEHGSGGALSRELVESVIHPVLRSDSYPELTDASPIEIGSDFLMTTDGYVVDPPFFPGGDIGRLSVFGHLQRPRRERRETGLHLPRAGDRRGIRAG